MEHLRRSHGLHLHGLFLKHKIIWTIPTIYVLFEKLSYCPWKSTIRGRYSDLLWSGLLMQKRPSVVLLYVLHINLKILNFRRPSTSFSFGNLSPKDLLQITIYTHPWLGIRQARPKQQGQHSLCIHLVHFGLRRP